MEVPSPGFPCFPTVVFSRFAQRSTNLKSSQVRPKVELFLLGINVDAEVEGLVGAVAPENDLRPLLAVRWDFPDHHHLLTVVVAEPDSLELHHHGQGGIVHRELRGKGDVVLLVRSVDEPDLLGRERYLLAGGGGTGVQLARHPGLVPGTDRHQLLVECPLLLTKKA